jgi:hypothetical protein
MAHNNVSDDDLLNITALFRRYKIPVKQLEVFINENNKEVFEYSKTGFSVNVYPAKKG